MKTSPMHWSAGKNCGIPENRLFDWNSCTPELIFLAKKYWTETGFYVSCGSLMMQADVTERETDHNDILTFAIWIALDTCSLVQEAELIWKPEQKILSHFHILDQLSSGTFIIRTLIQTCQIKPGRMVSWFPGSENLPQARYFASAWEMLSF